MFFLYIIQLIYLMRSQLDQPIERKKLRQTKQRQSSLQLIKNSCKKGLGIVSELLKGPLARWRGQNNNKDIQLNENDNELDWQFYRSRSWLKVPTGYLPPTKKESKKWKQAQKAQTKGIFKSSYPLQTKNITKKQRTRQQKVYKQYQSINKKPELQRDQLSEMGQKISEILPNQSHNLNSQSAQSQLQIFEQNASQNYNIGKNGSHNDDLLHLNRFNFYSNNGTVGQKLEPNWKIVNCFWQEYTTKAKERVMKSKLQLSIDQGQFGWSFYNPYKKVEECLRQNKNRQALQQIRNQEKRRLESDKRNGQNESWNYEYMIFELDKKKRQNYKHTSKEQIAQWVQSIRNQEKRKYQEQLQKQKQINMLLSNNQSNLANKQDNDSDRASSFRFFASIAKQNQSIFKINDPKTTVSDSPYVIVEKKAEKQSIQSNFSFFGNKNQKKETEIEQKPKANQQETQNNAKKQQTTNQKVSQTVHQPQDKHKQIPEQSEPLAIVRPQENNTKRYPFLTTPSKQTKNIDNPFKKQGPAVNLYELINEGKEVEQFPSFHNKKEDAGYSVSPSINNTPKNSNIANSMFDESQQAQYSGLSANANIPLLNTSNSNQQNQGSNFIFNSPSVNPTFNTSALVSPNLFGSTVFPNKNDVIGVGLNNPINLQSSPFGASFLNMDQQSKTNALNLFTQSQANQNAQSSLFETNEPQSKKKQRDRRSKKRGQDRIGAQK